MAIALQHLLQPAPLVRDMDEAMDHLQALFGMYPSERVHIRPSGVDNAVYALEDETFLELIVPFVGPGIADAPPGIDPAAGKLLARRGPGWHMVSFDVAPLDADRVDAGLEDAGVRVVRRNMHDEGVRAWHMHPRDVAGVLTLVADRAKVGDNTVYAGKAYRDYVATNTRVVRAVLGISWISQDVDALASRLGRVFALEFGAQSSDGDSVCRTATLPSGTWVQARSPAGDGTARSYLDRCGEGLYHVSLELRDDDALVRRAASLGLATTERGDALWLEPHEPLGFPIELRRA